jgi:hypothetical protein
MLAGMEAASPLWRLFWFFGNSRQFYDAIFLAAILDF